MHPACRQHHLWVRRHALAKVPLSGRLFGAENGVVRLSGNAVFLWSVEAVV